MNHFSALITPPNTVTYPLHRHTCWEIMYYLSGNGHMATQHGDIPFERGTIIVVPPQISHGSVSEDGFVNISVRGDFSRFFMFDQAIKLSDNDSRDGEQLATLIFNNRCTNNEYITSLCTSYANFLLQSVECESPVRQCITDVIKEISERCCDQSLNITDLLKKSGYAEDYIRCEFKRLTSLSPIAFLTRMRIDHAKNLLEIYHKNLTVAEIAEACGFSDVVYFSKKFKQYVGVSPNAYRKNIFEDTK